MTPDEALVMVQRLGIEDAEIIEPGDWGDLPVERQGCVCRQAGDAVTYWLALPGAPPVHELPTEPGAVVLVGGRPALLDASGWWHFIDDDGLLSREFAPSDWVPALVVPDDLHGPVAALRRVLDVAGKREGIPDDEARDLIEVEAREALESEGSL